MKKTNNSSLHVFKIEGVNIDELFPLNEILEA